MTRLYPYPLFLNTDGQKSVRDTLTTFHLLPGKEKPQLLAVDSVSFSSSTPNKALVNLQAGKSLHSVTVPCGGTASLSSPGHVETAYHSWLLSDLVLFTKNFNNYFPENFNSSSLITIQRPTVGRTCMFLTRKIFSYIFI